MVWKPEIGLGDILNLIVIIAAGIGLFLTYRQLRQTTQITRAEFIKLLVEEFYKEEIYGAFYQIDCELLSIEKIINSENDAYRELEISIDRLLAYLDMVARLVEFKVITEQDAMVLEYEFTTCFKSPEIQKYLTYLDKLYAKKKLNLKPIPYFRKFASSMIAKQPAAFQ